MPGLVRSNSGEKAKSSTAEAFELYAKDSSNLKPVIEKLSELKGIGPATASLLLAVHDPENVIFFSDEAFQWLTSPSKKPTYNFKEFDALFTKAKELIAKLKVSPIDIEKVAYVITKENEPVSEPKPRALPSGKPRGRPKLPDDQKKGPRVPSGLPAGRPPTSAPRPPKPAPSTKPRGRPERLPRTPEVEPAVATAKKKTTTPQSKKAATTPSGKTRGRPASTVKAATTPKGKAGRLAGTIKAATTPKGKARGRPVGTSKKAITTPNGKTRGRPPKVEEATTTPKSKKRKAEDEAPASKSTGRAKKAKV